MGGICFNFFALFIYLFIFPILKLFSLVLLCACQTPGGDGWGGGEARVQERGAVLIA